VFIPLTKLDIEKRDCSSALWSTFVDVDKHACEAVSGFVLVGQSSDRVFLRFLFVCG
jgi:hypothetical protein